MWFLKLLRCLGVWIDTAVYELLDLVYRLFLMIAEAGIFSPEQIQLFATRMYAFLGLIMVFKVSVALVTYIMNPDNFTKGEVGAPALLKGFFIALVGIVAVPYVFEAAFSLQRIVLANNVVGNLILGIASNDNGESDVDGNYIDKGGELMASTTLRAFYKPNTIIDGIDDACVADPCNCDAFITKFDSELQSYVKEVFCANPVVAGDILNKKIATATIKQDGEEEFVIDRTYFVTWAVGLFITYIMLLFCFDIAVRSVKLSFLQLIAPIPLLSRIDPKKGKKVFDNWIKECLTTYLDLFIRLVVIYFALFLISSLSLGAYNVVTQEKMTGGWNVVVTVFLIIGILNFTRDLPKLLSTLLGIDFKNMGGFSLNPMKNKNTAALGAGATAIGAGARQIRNGRRRALENQKAQNDWIKDYKEKMGVDDRTAQQAWKDLDKKKKAEAGFKKQSAFGVGARAFRDFMGTGMNAMGGFMAGKTWGDLAAMERQRNYDREMARAQGAETRGIFREMVNNMTGNLTQQQELQVREAQRTRDLLELNEEKRQISSVNSAYDSERNHVGGEVKKTKQYHDAENVIDDLENKLKMAQSGIEITDANGKKSIVHEVDGKSVEEWQKIVSNAKHAFQNYTTKDIINDYDESNGTQVREFIIDENGNAVNGAYKRNANGDIEIGTTGKPVVIIGGKTKTLKPNGDDHGADADLIALKNNMTAIIESSPIKDREIVVYKYTDDGKIMLDSNKQPIVDYSFKPSELADPNSDYYTDGPKRKSAVDAMKRELNNINASMAKGTEDLAQIKAQTTQLQAEHTFADTTGTKPGGGKG